MNSSLTQRPRRTLSPPAARADELRDPPADVVADRPDFLHRPALRVGQRPVVAFDARYEGALLAAPHGDQHLHAGGSSGVSNCGSAVERSMPASAMASRTSGCTALPGRVPADSARALAGSASWLNSAAAICERPALWTQAKRTVRGDIDLPPVTPAAARPQASAPG